MRLGTVTQLIAVHDKAIRTSPGVRLQRPLATHNSARVCGSVLGHSPDTFMQRHIPNGSPTAVPDFVGAAEAVLDAPEDKTEIQLGLTPSGADEECPPLPPVGPSHRPRPVSSRARGQNSDSEKRIAAAHGLEDNIHWI